MQNTEREQNARIGVNFGQAHYFGSHSNQAPPQILHQKVRMIAKVFVDSGVCAFC